MRRSCDCELSIGCFTEMSVGIWLMSDGLNHSDIVMSRFKENSAELQKTYLAYFV